MRKLAAAILLALALSALWPAPQAHAGSSLAVFGGWHFSHEGGGFDTLKGGAEYEWRAAVPLLPKIFEFALALPFTYYEAEPDIGAFRHVEVKVYSVVPTAKAYLTLTPALHPYAGVGLGWARSEFDEPVGGSEDGLAVRVIAGAEYLLFPASPFLVFGEYEYTTLDLDEPRDLDLGGNALLAGVRLRW